LVAHNIKRGGKTLELGEEFSSYDKVKSRLLLNPIQQYPGKEEFESL
jgi:hypothetical protein